MAWPVRTGLPTAHNEAEKLEAILQKYAGVQALILTPDQLEKIADLLACLANFLRDVPSHEPLP